MERLQEKAGGEARRPLCASGRLYFQVLIINLIREK